MIRKISSALFSACILLGMSANAPAHAVDVQDQNTSLDTVVKVSQSLNTPEEAKKLGHHGKVILTGTILSDGKIANLEISLSSRSDILDEHALNRYSSARLGDKFLDTDKDKVRLEITYADYRLETLSDYVCAQAVLDFQWFYSEFAESKRSRPPYINLLSGLNLLAGRKELNFLRNKDKADKAIYAALSECKKNPDKSFLGYLIQKGN